MHLIREHVACSQCAVLQYPDWNQCLTSPGCWIFIGTICIPNSVQHPEGLNIIYEIYWSSRAWWTFSLIWVFRARLLQLFISRLITYRNRSVMFILMVTPGMGGSWLLVTPPRYYHLTLSRSMSGWAARSTLTHVLASRPPHRDWVSDVGAALRPESC